MSIRVLNFPRWRLYSVASVLALGVAAMHTADAQPSPSSTAPAYGGAATEGGPGSTNAATGQRVPQPPPPAGTHTPAPQSAGQAQGQAEISNADRNLMRTLAQVHLAEVEMGKMAQTRSQDVQVRSFAQRMIDDHGKALEQLRKLANAKGVVLPGGPDKKQAAAKEKLTAMSGDQFNLHYMTHAADTAHREAHQLLQKAVQSAQDPELKAHVGNSLALVEQHMKIGNHLIAKNQSRFKSQPMGGPLEGQAGRKTENQSDGKTGTPSGTSQAAQQESSAPPAQQGETRTAPGSAPR